MGQASKKGQIILGSSGTTGKPKLIKHDSVSLVSTIQSYCKVLSLTSSDRCIIAIPMSHISGLGEVLSCVFTGCQFVMLENLSSSNIAEQTIKYKPSYISLSAPVIYDLLTKAEEHEELRKIFNNSRKVRTGGGYIPKDTITKFYEHFGVKLEILYGATECSPIMYNYQKNDSKKVSLGKPIDGVDVKILSKRSPGHGDIGELYIRSKSLFKGYISDNTETIFSNDNWYCRFS